MLYDCIDEYICKNPPALKNYIFITENRTTRMMPQKVIAFKNGADLPEFKSISACARACNLSRYVVLLSMRSNSIYIDKSGNRWAFIRV